MKFSIYQSLSLLISIIAFSVFGKDLYIEGRTVYHDCSYYSSTSVDLRITYLNENLPWGTTVEAVFGFEETDSSYGVPKVTSWQNRKIAMMNPSTEYTWQLDIEEFAAERGRAQSYTGLDFVIKVTVPGNLPFYEKGNDSPLGYFHTPFGSENYEINGCYPNSVPELQKFYFYDVKK